MLVNFIHKVDCPQFKHKPEKKTGRLPNGTVVELNPNWSKKARRIVAAILAKPPCENRSLIRPAQIDGESFTFAMLREMLEQKPSYHEIRPVLVEAIETDDAAYLDILCDHYNVSDLLHLVRGARKNEYIFLALIDVAPRFPETVDELRAMLQAGGDLDALREYGEWIGDEAAALIAAYELEQMRI